jgi:hypothetical protein
MYRLIIAAFLIDLYFDHEDGGDIFLQNIGEVPKYLPIYLWLYSPFVGPQPLFNFLILCTFGRTPWPGISPFQGR